LADILDITESQAKALRAIACYEAKSDSKGATQYSCFKKLPNRLHVSGSTFNDNVKDLEKNQMITPVRGIKKTGGRKTKPYTITEIGQVAWLRHFPLSENIEIIQEIFPNIQLSAIDNIIDQISHHYIKYINKFSIGILKIALDSYHIEESRVIPEYMKKLAKEKIEISTDEGHLETSLTRWYKVVKPGRSKKLKSKYKSDGIENFDELKISVIDRITFLFYYNLIQAVTDSSYQMIFSKITPADTFLYKIMRDEQYTELTKFLSEKGSELSRNVEELRKELVKKKREILKIITSNDTVNKIIQDNLKDIGKHKDQSFENISKIVIKA
jgi:DNA-binding MarR family transcriptional regulator